MLKSTCKIPFGLPKLVSCLSATRRGHGVECQTNKELTARQLDIVRYSRQRAISGVSIMRAGCSEGSSGGGLMSKFVAMNGFATGKCRSSLDSAILVINVSQFAVGALLYFVVYLVFR